MKNLHFIFILLLLPHCGQFDDNYKYKIPFLVNRYTNKTIGEIIAPDGYKRLPVQAGSFVEWLRKIPLRKDNHVYLYNGSLKENQSAQFAVLDMPIGKKDLQQCADAVMRLRAEYLFAVKKFDSIKFIDNAGKLYAWQGKENRAGFDSYLETVFAYCGSASLAKQLRPVVMYEMQPGDVFIKGGFPGHAMLVVDMAINNKGKKIFMLAQSYMPAQDIHIVKNPASEQISPWYEVNEMDKIITPEWVFYRNQLSRW